MDQQPPIVEQETPAETTMASPIPVAPMAQASVETPVVDDGELKSYLAMMLLAFFAGPSGLARVYRGEKSGWVRFWIYIVSYILTFVFIGTIGILVMTIWGIVDFFLLHKTHTDVTGRPLYTTALDTKVAGILQRIMIILLALLALGLIVFILMFGVIMTSFSHGFNSNSYQTY